MIAATLIGVLAIVLNFVQSAGFKSEEILLFEQVKFFSAAHKEESEEEMLNDASLEIKMSFQPPHSKKVEDKLLATGLGSLVWNGSRTLLVTHNHWGEVLADATVVTFYDVDQKVLKIMLGKDFKDLVIYRDAGTLVLKAPNELARLIDPLSPRPSLGDSGHVKVGDTVLLSYHKAKNKVEIGLLEAKIESVYEYKALPVFVLRSLDGTPVVQGDSGGGIWHDGKLVGNLWATIVRDTGNKALTFTSDSMSVQQLTNQSFGAIFPEKVGESR